PPPTSTLFPYSTLFRSNMLKLAPWIWDNVKILFYWWIASAPLVALLLARLWNGSMAHRVSAAVLFVLLTLAGGLDVFALVTRQGARQSTRLNSSHLGIL